MFNNTNKPQKSCCCSILSIQSELFQLLVRVFYLLDCMVGKTGIHGNSSFSPAPKTFDCHPLLFAGFLSYYFWEITRSDLKQKWRREEHTHIILFTSTAFLGNAVVLHKTIEDKTVNDWSRPGQKKKQILELKFSLLSYWISISCLRSNFEFLFHLHRTFNQTILLTLPFTFSVILLLHAPEYEQSFLAMKIFDELCSELPFSLFLSYLLDGY